MPPPIPPRPYPSPVHTPDADGSAGPAGAAAATPKATPDEPVAPYRPEAKSLTYAQIQSLQTPGGRRFKPAPESPGARNAGSDVTYATLDHSASGPLYATVDLTKKTPRTAAPLESDPADVEDDSAFAPPLPERRYDLPPPVPKRENASAPPVPKRENTSPPPVPRRENASAPPMPARDPAARAAGAAAPVVSTQQARAAAISDASEKLGARINTLIQEFAASIPAGSPGHRPKGPGELDSAAAAVKLAHRLNDAALADGADKLHQAFRGGREDTPVARDKQVQSAALALADQAIAGLTPAQKKTVRQHLGNLPSLGKTLAAAEPELTSMAASAVRDSVFQKLVALSKPGA
ncbi:hypothetical protein [Mitsuaria sp. GD03876]|uniref:hypothetical protein n=1 Tax=Mitsuaria sp. GD03876 TaxID=2975399 RepID=UPI0024484D3A|nr:hypothetical protein [Mitsuaria sp. GD03876]MDH0867968.1 hypothetical protein [Mitsuaria sp. GD03876]